MSDGMKYWMQEREQLSASARIRQTRDSLESIRKHAQEEIRCANSELEALQKCCPHEHVRAGDEVTSSVCLDCGKVLK